jgi:hypothetical protein
VQVITSYPKTVLTTDIQIEEDKKQLFSFCRERSRSGERLIEFVTLVNSIFSSKPNSILFTICFIMQLDIYFRVVHLRREGKCLRDEGKEKFVFCRPQEEARGSGRD